MMNQAPHSLDLMIWLGGQPTSVMAQAFNRAHAIETEDTVNALLDYGGGHTGYFYTTTAQWPGQNRFEFTGDRGQLVRASIGRGHRDEDFAALIVEVAADAGLVLEPETQTDDHHDERTTR